MTPLHQVLSKQVKSQGIGTIIVKMESWIELLPCEKGGFYETLVAVKTIKV
jgi:hypothetical protein